MKKIMIDGKAFGTMKLKDIAKDLKNFSVCISEGDYDICNEINLKGIQTCAYCGGSKMRSLTLKEINECIELSGEDFEIVVTRIFK